jgi:hypothetical protein
MSELNDLIRQTIENHPNWHPHKIAATVCELTEPDQLEAFYLALLEPYITQRIGQHRNYTLNQKDAYSAKVTRRRNWWKQAKAERLPVGDQWKFLRECTVADLDIVIELRYRKIGELQGQVEKYEKIRAAMQEHGAATVDDLPDDAVQL